MGDKVRPQCGSLYGCQIHAKLGEEPCNACRQERREQSREYRSRPEVKARRRAERRTVARLKREFPARYMTILDEEMARSLKEEFTEEGDYGEVNDV